MFYKKNTQTGFADGYIERRIRKNTFFRQVNTLIDWSEIEKEITKVYKHGHSVDGRPAYSGLLLFRMLLIGIWYSLSDERAEESVNENLSMMRFCDLDSVWQSINKSLPLPMPAPYRPLWTVKLSVLLIPYSFYKKVYLKINILCC